MPRPDLTVLVDVVGYGGLTYGAFWYGGPGAAGLVGGFCCLLLSFSLASAKDTTAAEQPLIRVPRTFRRRPPRIETDVITNASLAEQQTAGR